MSKDRDLLRLEEERAQLKYLLTGIKLSPDFRAAVEGHLTQVEKLIADAKKTAQ
jgi:hypothetical protein